MSILEVPGARLRYTMIGDGPLIVFIPGARGDGGGYAMVAQHISTSFKALTYDRRGYGGSELDGPQDYDVRLQTDADDVASLVEKEGGGHGIVFGNSSGAIVALQVLSSRPEVVKMLFAHEPPALTRLPEATGRAIIASNYAMYDTYRASGLRAAMASFTDDVMSASDQKTLGANAAAATPADRAQAARNFEYWFQHELRRYPETVFDDAKLKAAADRLTFAAGDDSRNLYPHKIALLFAEQLGVPAKIVPGGHVGFASFGESFARSLAAHIVEAEHRVSRV